MKIKSFVAVSCFLPGWAKDLSAPLIEGKIEGRIEVTGRGRRRPKQLLDYLNVVVPKVSFADPKGSGISSQWIHGYISVIATLKFTYFC
jgi:hypothetical protein